MEKIINGKRYNTDTANEVGYFSNGFIRTDFDFYEETLYKKKNGEFFLETYGGARTKNAEYRGYNTWSGGTRIIPLTDKEAQAWAEKHLSTEDYLKIFEAEE